jgi:hypothetical protein
MKIQFKSLSVIGLAALLLAGAVSAGETPPFRIASMRVQPVVAVSSPGRTLSLEVRCEGIDGVCFRNPVRVAGAPPGTGIQVKPLSEKSARVILAFPFGTPKGRWQLAVQVGFPEPLLEQKIEIDIRE